MAHRAKHPQGKLTLDAQDLAYISSAGLRIVMRLRKQDDSLSIVNLSNDVYDVFEMTGLSTLMPVRRMLRQMSVDGLEFIGE